MNCYRLRSLQKRLRVQGVQHGKACSAGNSIAAIGAASVAGEHPLEDAAGGDYGRQWHTVGQRLAQHKDVGLDGLPRVCEETPRSPIARLDLVNDEQRSDPLAAVPDPSQEAWWWRHVAPRRGEARR